MSADGTDIPIMDPSPFNTRWFSYKLNGSSLRYEVRVIINEGHNVWINGTFRAGEFSDVQIFRQDLHKEPKENKKDCADDGYGIRECLRNCPLEDSEKMLFAGNLSRYETVNGWLKRFKVVNTPFRHEVFKHKVRYYAIAEICQTKLFYEEPLFSL